MPSAPKRPCRTPGCPGLVDAGFCASCTGKGLGKEERPTSAQRGYGYRWQKASKAFLARHPFAVDYFGDHNGRVYRAEVVDHIIPHRGDMKLFWDPGNWQGLTMADHSRKTALEDGAFGNARSTAHTAR
jgi:5-methylcytosine-specific restriction enzyme A